MKNRFNLCAITFFTLAAILLCGCIKENSAASSNSSNLAQGNSTSPNIANVSLEDKVYQIIKEEPIVKNVFFGKNDYRLNYELRDKYLAAVEKSDLSESEKDYILSSYYPQSSSSGENVNPLKCAVFEAKSLDKNTALAQILPCSHDYNIWFKVNLDSKTIIEKFPEYEEYNLRSIEQVNQSTESFEKAGSGTQEFNNLIGKLFYKLSDDELINLNIELFKKHDERPSLTDEEFFNKTPLERLISKGVVVILPDDASGELVNSVDEIKATLSGKYGLEEGSSIFEYYGNEIKCEEEVIHNTLGNRLAVIIGNKQNNSFFSCTSLFASYVDSPRYTVMKNPFSSQPNYVVLLNQVSASNPEADLNLFHSKLKSGDESCCT